MLTRILFNRTSRFLRFSSSSSSFSRFSRQTSFNHPSSLSSSSLSVLSSSSFSSVGKLLSELGLTDQSDNIGVFSGKWQANGPVIESVNPSTNKIIAKVKTGNGNDYEQCLQAMGRVKRQWALTPAPKRGDVVRRMGEILRSKKKSLGRLVSLENGKILAEGEGEVQEAIDICDFAVGLSRTINGQVIPSERPGHVMLECWNPLNGHVGIITAFNFPVAVAFWNAAISLVCGNTQIWKGASSVPLITLATAKIMEQAFVDCGYPPEIACTITGSGREVGGRFGPDKRLELISFTGSTGVGKAVNEQIVRRFGKSIMELGGNNGAIIMDDADIDLALNAVFFAAVGTAGQRCTTMRRLFLHEKIYDEFLSRLLAKYKQVQIGDPLDEKTLCGPLITKEAVKDYEKSLAIIKKSSKSKILFGGNVLNQRPGNFVEPTIVEAVHTEPFVNEELFAPVLYVMKIKNFEEAVEMHNSVVHGLSSSLFTKRHDYIFGWLSPVGSDCGIVNVNIGTSGAEIGGAFGGEKETGSGRESGSDSWKQYMRRSTCTINYSSGLVLAQGIKFGSH